MNAGTGYMVWINSTSEWLLIALIASMPFRSKCRIFAVYYDKYE